MCSVGDLKNNLRILQSEARQMKYSRDFDLEGLTKGNPHALLPLYNHIFTSYNAQFSAEVLEILNDNLYMKSDVRFMEAVYKILRDLFHFKPSMTKEQFFTTNNFAERKVIMCVEVMRLVQQHCRFKGPKNPTNPNIKVTSVVDNRRCHKKSSTELVVQEPVAEIEPTRKVSEKSRTKITSLGINETGWHLKVGYLQPDMKEPGELKPREDKREKNEVEKENSEKKGERMGVVASVVREFSPKVHSAEAINLPQDEMPEKRSQRVTDVPSKTPGQPHADWDPTGAVEVILAKVRDLPAQLTNFMKAVDSRLQMVEERLDRVEGNVGKLGTSVTQAMTQDPQKSSEAKAELTTLQARLLLLENRVMLLETKATPESKSPESVKPAPAMEEKKTTEFTPAPFVSLERGEDIFPGSTFSPIRQELGDFNPNNNDTLASIVDEDRRLSSTPNHSLNSKIPPHHQSRSNCVAQPEKKTDDDMSAVNNSTLPWENLDSSTRQQVQRINQLFKATQLLFPSAVEQQQAGT